MSQLQILPTKRTALANKLAAQIPKNTPLAIIACAEFVTTVGRNKHRSIDINAFITPIETRTHVITKTWMTSPTDQHECPENAQKYIRHLTDQYGFTTIEKDWKDERQIAQIVKDATNKEGRTPTVLILDAFNPYNPCAKIFNKCPKVIWLSTDAEAAPKQAIPDNFNLHDISDFCELLYPPNRNIQKLLHITANNPNKTIHELEQLNQIQDILHKIKTVELDYYDAIALGLTPQNIASHDLTAYDRAIKCYYSATTPTADADPSATL